MFLIRQGFTYLQCTYQHYCLATDNTQNLSHYQEVSSSTKTRFAVLRRSSILPNKISLILLTYALIHCPNRFTNHQVSDEVYQNI